MTESHREKLLEFIRLHKPFKIEGVKPEYAKIIEQELYSNDEFLNGFLDHMQSEFMEGANNEPCVDSIIRKCKAV